MDLKQGRYKHFKGGNYRLIGIAKHSETLEDLVVYECLDNQPQSKLWVRPLKMFLEKVYINGKKVSRFQYIGDN
jgi:hypothetical protein